jgi:predicted acylesterase/phospholipase RssA
MVQLKKKTNRDRMAKSQVDISSSNKDNNSSNISSLLSLQSRLSTAAYYNNRLENVLILQGGGSLGAFGCGVFKALTNNDIKLDIVAGTSIGGINAAIIAGSKDEKHPEQALEQFWLELSEGFVNLDKMTLSSSSSVPKFLEEMLLPFRYYYYNLPICSSDKQEENHSGFLKEWCS